jgi:alcohol dehydrogenase (cytochrome c)
MSRRRLIVTGLPVLGALASLAAPGVAQTTATPNGDWMTFNRTLRGDRYSPLREITPANVRRLRPVAAFETGVECSFQTGPVVVDGMMYLTTYKHTYAIDAATGKLKWKHVRSVEKTGLGSHRGVGYLNGRVFRGASDGYVYALNAENGRSVWNVKIADPKQGESIPMAPIAWNGLVFVGNAGGDNFGVTGRIYALDAATGKQVWKFNTVPSTGPAAATWLKKSQTNPPTGGATWTTYSLEPSTGVLYVCTGNPAPDFAEQLHPGENLYATCVLALDARSGRLLAYAQPTPRDFHDWDVAAAPALITTRRGRQMAATGGKDGFLHGIDVGRVNRAMASGSKPQDAAADIHGAAGSGAMSIRYRTPVTRRFNTRAPLTAARFTRFAPGSQGGVEWNGPAYLPGLNLIVVPAIDWPTSVKLAPLSKIMSGKPGEAWSGAHDNGFGRQDPPSRWGGYLTALDADSGAVRWKYRSPTPQVAAVTTTAGGLVFTGDLNGDVRAFDARTGKVLWRHRTGRAIGGGVVSYEAGGRQYLAVAAGMSAPIWPTKKTTARVVIYRLP